MSRKGNCYDYAVAESFFSTLKNELVHHQTYHTRDEASREIFAFIEGFYNRHRLPQSLRHLTPLAFEQRVSDSSPGVHETRGSSLSLPYPTKKGREELLTAAVERGPSEGARSGSKESSSHPCHPHFLDCRGKAVLA